MSAATVVLAAPEQKSLMFGLLSAYLTELGTPSAPYPYLPLYWREPERFPYVIVAGVEIVGFALVRQVGVASEFEMAEFYVVPGHRRAGIGRRAARELFAKHRGTWRVDAAPSNVQAQAFWASVVPARIHSLTDTRFVFQYEEALVVSEQRIKPPRRLQ